jgi:glycosyltransferase involved in cell wall biosynthesis
LTKKPSISVLVANFDWDVTDLVTTLHRQLTESSIPFEIICSDNAENSSVFEKNNLLNDLDNTSYQQELNFVGRSQNRNHMAHQAKHDWLLFLDADSAISNPKFIRTYLDEVDNAQVVCGGTAYGDKPNSKEGLLRWTYGKAREEISAEKRNKKPNLGFSSFNFMIYREAFEMVKFSSEFVKYGHEDTLLGQDLQRHGFIVKHINNPLVHLGLDDGEQFLAKSRDALQNLKQLLDGIALDEQSKLAALYNTIGRYGLKPVAKTAFKIFSKRWERNLLGDRPSMRVFDAYKLGYLSSL